MRRVGWLLHQATALAVLLALGSYALIAPRPDLAPSPAVAEVAPPVAEV